MAPARGKLFIISSNALTVRSLINNSGVWCLYSLLCGNRYREKQDKFKTLVKKLRNNPFWGLGNMNESFQKNLCKMNKRWTLNEIKVAQEVKHWLKNERYTKDKVKNGELKILL